MHVKKGDKVKVITGKDKGKEGVILAAFPKQDRVLVEGVNIVKKHVKPNQLNPQGGIVSQEAAIHVSNVMLIDPKFGYMNLKKSGGESRANDEELRAYVCKFKDKISCQIEIMKPDCIVCCGCWSSGSIGVVVRHAHNCLNCGKFERID